MLFCWFVLGDGECELWEDFGVVCADECSFLWVEGIVYVGN